MREQLSPTESKYNPLRRDRLVLVIFGALFSLLCWQISTSMAEDRLLPFISTSHQISFNYDPSLVQEKIELPAAVVALRDPQGGFPSFNVLVSAESYDPAAISEDAYREKIINDYRAVGITDARSVRTYSSLVAGVEVHTTELRYKFKEQLLIAAVTLVPAGSGKQLIVTYIDLADQFYRRKVIREDIVNSFKLLTPAALNSSGATAEGTSASPNYWATVLALLGAILAVAAGCIILKRRASSGTP